MTAVPVPRPTPAVELRFHPTDLDEGTLREALRPLGSPSEAIEAALMTARLMVVTQAKAEVAALTGEMSAAKLIGIADLAWQVYAPTFLRSLGPVFAEEYLRTMRAAGAGDIPMATVYALAEQHAARMGTHFHESSRDALGQGFNTFVNRRMTERVAADRVLDGYGLTARGMAGYTSRSLDKANTVTPLKLKERVGDYIGTSVRRRSRLFATQEQHNISQQARQVAWMWMQDKGQITAGAEKVWITARDERTCDQCAPMHGVRVPVTERFTLPNGTQVYVPGMHPNCRCTAELLDHPWMATVDKRGVLSKAETWNPKEHPRGGDSRNPGRFSAKARSSPTRPPVTEQQDYSAFQRFLDTAAEQIEEEVKPKVVIDDRPKVVISDRSPVVINDRPPPVVVNDRPQRLTINDPAAPKEKLTITNVADERVKPVFRPSPKQRLLINEGTAKTIIRGLAEVKAKLPPPPSRPHKDTIRLDGPGGPGPVYYIATPYEMAESEHYRDGLIELNTEMEFGQEQTHGDETGEDAMARAAREYFNEQLTSESDAMWENEENYLERTDEHGTSIRALIPEEHLYDIVAAAAWNDPGGPGDDHMRIDWTIDSPGSSSHGEPVATEYMRYSEVAQEMKLSPESFVLSVLVLTEGHNSDLGKTRQLATGTRYGDEVWTGTGLYRLEPMTGVIQEANGPPIRFMHLVPEGIEPYDVIPPGYVPPEDDEPTPGRPPYGL